MAGIDFRLVRSAISIAEVLALLDFQSVRAGENTKPLSIFAPNSTGKFPGSKNRTREEEPVFENRECCGRFPHWRRPLLHLSLDRQVVSQNCADCGAGFSVIRGSVYDESQPVGLYVIALHGHGPDGKLAHLAISVLDRSEKLHPYAVALTVRVNAHQFTFSVDDWSVSPWKGETYLGVMLDRSAALASLNKELFFHIADHVVSDLPEVGEYFD